jgi:hypothetical protein
VVVGKSGCEKLQASPGWCRRAAALHVESAMQNEICMTSDAFTAEQNNFDAAQCSLCERSISA